MSFESEHNEDSIIELLKKEKKKKQVQEDMQEDD